MIDQKANTKEYLENCKLRFIYNVTFLLWVKMRKMGIPNRKMIRDKDIHPNFVLGGKRPGELQLF